MLRYQVCGSVRPILCADGPLALTIKNVYESRWQMDQLNPLGGSDECSATDDEPPLNEE